MFSYIALAWNDAVQQQAATARRLSLELRSRGHWHAALACPGLDVYVRGARPGINSACALGADRGLVLGQLFRRGDLQRSPRGVAALTAEESARIILSGGQDLVRDFWGRYVAFMQTASGATTVVRDPSGTLPCYLTRHDGVQLVFSWLEDVLTDLPTWAHPCVNWEGLSGQILFGELGGRETALGNVTQVLPGEALELGDGPPDGSLLWNAVEFARSASDEAPESAASRLRATVRGCVQAWASSYEMILLRLSGGVDSSILLSCLDRGGTSAGVVCVNYHSPGSDSDERRYARLAVAGAQRELIERERDPAFPLERILHIARTATPSNHVGRMSARMDAELAADRGAQALFTGAGGDQLFFEFGRWWPGADYLRCRGLDAGFLRAAMDAARLGKVSVWKAIASAMGERLRPTQPWLEAQSHLPLIGPAALNMAGQRERFVHPALLQAADLPIGKATQTQSLLHPVAYYDPFELDAAPEAVNPLLSQPLVELCLQLPTWVLAQGGRGRALARRAFGAELPPEIARRRTKGGMEEHIKAVLLRNIDFARGLLLDGELVRRGLLERARVEEALSGRPTALASHIGRIHVYIGIEAWLSRWSPRPRQAES